MDTGAEELYDALHNAYRALEHMHVLYYRFISVLDLYDTFDA